VVPGVGLLGADGRVSCSVRHGKNADTATQNADTTTQDEDTAAQLADPPDHGATSRNFPCRQSHLRWLTCAYGMPRDCVALPYRKEGANWLMPPGGGCELANATLTATRPLGSQRDRPVSEEPDIVRYYLDEVGETPLLTANQEVELAKRIEAGVYAAELLRRADEGEITLDYDRRDLEIVARDGQRAKDHMIRANLRLVVTAARKNRHTNLPLLDAIQEGNLGLIRAVEKFDYAKGFKFSTYAMWWIR